MKLFDQFGRLIGRKAPALITNPRDADAMLRKFGRRYTMDSQAYNFRMPAGFAGDVNRTHPVSIEPATPDPTHPPTLFGLAGVIDATSNLFRVMQAGDTALTDVYGFVARPYPFQQQNSTGNPGYGAASIGNAGPGNVNKLDIMKSGYMMVQLNNYVAAPSAKGGTIYVWIAATAANHVQGGVEASPTGGSTIALPTPLSTFNGAPDSTGVVEICFRS